jgi:hypothetical protein
MTHFLLDDQIASQPEAVRDALRRTEPPQLDPNPLGMLWPVIIVAVG